MHFLSFTFWETSVVAQVPTQRDRDHLRYYFTDYLTRTPAKPDIFVGLGVARGNSSFWDTKPTERLVRISEKHSGVTSDFSGNRAATMPTPLTPFGLHPLRGLFRTVHGAAATHPVFSDTAVLIHGDSGSGKSTLLVELLKRGWGFLSDDTVPIAKKGFAHPYTRPLGLRSQLAERLGLGEGSPVELPVFRTPTGITRAAHPRLLGFDVSDPARIRWVVSLIATTGPLSVTQNSPNRLLLELDVARDCLSAADAIEELCQ